MGVSRRQLEQWQKEGAIFTDADFEGLRTLVGNKPYLYNWEEEDDSVSGQDQ